MEFHTCYMFKFNFVFKEDIQTRVGTLDG